MPCLYGITLAVSDIASSVRPWNAWSKATIGAAARAVRAIFTAFSTASAPEFANIVFFAKVAGRERVQALGELDVRLVRRDVEAGVGVELGLPLDRRRPPRGRCGPTFRTAMPVAKSISRLPSTSSTIAPEARAVTIGWMFATPVGDGLRRAARTTRGTSGRGSR